MDKAQCVVLFPCGSSAVVCSPIPGDLERKDGQEHSRALALAQKPEGFSGWWGNVAEAPGGWALSLVAEFPGLVTHLLQSSGEAENSEAENKLPLLLSPGQASWQTGQELGALASCCSAHMWLRQVNQH